MSGPVPNAACIFPFQVVDGETFYTCLAEEWNDWKHWCPTKLDDYGFYKHDYNNPDTWGNCSPECMNPVSLSCGDNRNMLSTVINIAINNGQVGLRCNDYERIREWDKIYEGKDGWIKLRHYRSGKILQLSPDGEHLSVSYNLEPCHGQKPCLR